MVFSPVFVHVWDMASKQYQYMSLNLSTYARLLRVVLPYVARTVPNTLIVDPLFI